MKSKLTRRFTLSAIGVIGCLVMTRSLLKANSLCACGHPARSALRMNHRSPVELKAVLSDRFPTGSSLNKLRQRLWLPDYLENEALSASDIERSKRLYSNYCLETEYAVICQIDFEEDLWSLRKRGYTLRFSLTPSKKVTEITVEKTQRLDLDAFGG